MKQTSKYHNSQHTSISIYVETWFPIYKVKQASYVGSEGLKVSMAIRHI